MTHRIRRRDFLGLTAAVGAGAAISTLTAGHATAAGAVRTADPIQARIGFIDNDANPFASSLTSFGDSVPLALDNNYRSVGADLGSTRQVSAIELVPNDEGDRLNSRDLSVYASMDNASWSKIPAELVDLGGSLWLYGFTTKAPYLKVHCHRGEVTGSTFILNNIQADVRAYRLDHGQFVGSGGGTWHYKTPILVTNPTNTRLRDRAVYLSFAALGVEHLVAAGRLAGDLSDLRFADDTAAELHAYADASGIFVRIPDIAAKRTLTIFAYSGNPSAVNRVAHDVGALQVQYGYTTVITQPTPPDVIKPIRLPDGTMMLVSSVRPPSGLTARFSRDGGRTWSDSEQILPPTPGVPNIRIELPSGYLLDPHTNVLTFVYTAAGVNMSGDWTDPTKNYAQVFVVQARSYTSDGRPVFGTATQIPLHRVTDGYPVAYAISYTSPILTRSGAYVLPISYIIRPDGTFAVGVVRSTDGGLTWTQQHSELTLPGEIGYLEAGVSENGVGQLGDGRLIILARQESDRKTSFALSQSVDDGVTWTPIVDSTILASNTQPTLLGGQGRPVTLTFSGHNTFRQSSYGRNDLTAAVSYDDARTWQGYHNLIAATSLATPGWFSTAEIRRSVNPDSAPSGIADRLFAWDDPGGPGQTLLIEDFDSYVQQSHGALDVISYRSAEGATDGTELAQSGWWRTLRPGTLDLVPGPRPAAQAVRLRTTPPNETAASRLFPAIQQGTVRFALRWTSLASGLRLSLQEAYGDHSLTAGTVLALRLTPKGDLLATTQPPAELPAIGLGAETDPATARWWTFGGRGSAALDYGNRSVAADLFEPAEVTGVQLVDDDKLTAAGTRLQPANLRVWVADTNDTPWRQLTDWTAVKQDNVFTISGPPVITRYIKVSQPYSDTAFTFGNEQQRLLRVLPDREAADRYTPLPVATQLSQDDWHLIELGVDLAAGIITVSVNGVHKARLRQLSPANVATHLLVLLEESSDPSEVALDGFLVQDTARGLPALAHVGPTTDA